jgi:NAD(P)-dependent dehydrogenase (short-subunit alcohol dehydrogenase family)
MGESAAVWRARPLTECRVLITGGTSGVGLATAIRFAEAGCAAIAIAGRNAERGEAALRKVREQVPQAPVHFFAGDCNRPDSATAVCEAAHKAFGGIDVLVNSTTGSYAPKLLFKTGIEEIQTVLLEQIMAPLLTSRIVLPWMTAQGGGAIVNVASDAAKVATPGETVISAAMAGIVMFTRTLAIEAKRNGIRVNVVTPSIIEGTATHGKVMNDEFAGKLFGKAIQLAHLGVVNAGDMADLIVFLASPQAAKISGQAISLNGGISAA